MTLGSSVTLSVANLVVVEADHMTPTSEVFPIGTVCTLVAIPTDLVLGGGGMFWAQAASLVDGRPLLILVTAFQVH